jgi:hypothetical protein
VKLAEILLPPFRGAIHTVEVVHWAKGSGSSEQNGSAKNSISLPERRILPTSCLRGRQRRTATVFPNAEYEYQACGKAGSMSQAADGSVVSIAACRPPDPRALTMSAQFSSGRCRRRQNPRRTGPQRRPTSSGSARSGAERRCHGRQKEDPGPSGASPTARRRIATFASEVGARNFGCE